MRRPPNKAREGGIAINPNNGQKVKIQTKDLSKSYHFSRNESYPVLDNINLQIESGDFIVIIGESGCGKSTLLNIIAGLLPATSGEVWVNQKQIKGPDSKIAMLFQEPILLPWLTVEENISFGCKLRGDTENIAYRACQFIEMIGLSGFENSLPDELSVGMAHRVCLARALIGHPDVLLLDEPFSALDSFNRSRLQEEFINIWQSEGFTAVFVTHDIEEAVLLGQKVLLFGGAPAEIQTVFDIDAQYPRKLTSLEVYEMKVKILAKLKKIVIQKPPFKLSCGVKNANRLFKTSFFKKMWPSH